MTVSTGDILRIVASLVWDDGEIAQNVYAAIVTGGGGPWDDSDIVDDAIAWLDILYTAMEGQLSDTINGSQIQVYVWDTVGLDWDEVGSIGWTFVGTSVSDELPRGVAALVNAHTTDPDIQGKKYFPGYTEGSVVDGLFASAVLIVLLAALEDWTDAFTGAVSGASWAPAVWSPTEVDGFALTGSGTVSAIPAYQRRRKNNVGI